jgi:apolipoprotein D and lipocalin family protein
MKKMLSIFIIVLISGCSTSIPKGITPIQNFQLDQYLGKWYEIARLDHSFERGLSHVTAEYSLRDDGGITVINKGYDQKKKNLKEADGKAYFVKDEETGHLKVSFFGPFYASYIIFEMDKEYQHALISGPDKSYFWILSRTPKLDKNILERLIQKANEHGFATDNLILVDQKER